MTNKLRDELARVICRAGITGPKEHLDEQETLHWHKFTCEAQAIIDHLAPTMREVIVNLKKCDDLLYKIRCDWSDPRSEAREGRELIRKSLASLSEWQKKGE